MLIIGLTGSIGMGKSTTADMFRACGVPVHDSDGAVHALYKGEACAPLATLFPGVVGPDGVDRPRLAEIVLKDQTALRQLEGIVHPLVAAHRRAFLRACAQRGARIVVCDVPLLLETGMDSEVDVILVVSAPAMVQKSRVLARAGMTDEKFAAIMSKQMPDAEKRRRAHAVIDTGRGFEPAQRQIATLLRALASAGGRPSKANNQGSA